jgi:hypothetical protein
MNRRKFIQLSCYTVAGGGFFVLSQAKSAFFPWAARFIFGNTVRRGAVRSAINKGAAKAVGRSAFKSISMLDLALVSGSIISVSPSLFASIRNYQAEALWIQNNFENNYYLLLKNHSNKKRSANFCHELRDIDTGKIEIEKPCGPLYAAPSDEFKFPFSISDLPYLGAKRLYATTDSEDLIVQPSNPIIITTEDQVYLDEKN